MVCSGSNQAYTNLAIALLDDGDAAVIFAPYYFNHKMALQMTGCSVVVGQTDNSLLPDMGWLRARLAENPKVIWELIIPGQVERLVFWWKQNRHFALLTRRSKREPFTLKPRP